MVISEQSLDQKDYFVTNRRTGSKLKVPTRTVRVGEYFYNYSFEL